MHSDQYKPKPYLKLIKKYIISEGEQFPLSLTDRELTMYLKRVLFTLRQMLIHPEEFGYHNLNAFIFLKAVLTSSSLGWLERGWTCSDWLPTNHRRHFLTVRPVSDCRCRFSRFASNNCSIFRTTNIFGFHNSVKNSVLVEITTF